MKKIIIDMSLNVTVFWFGMWMRTRNAVLIKLLQKDKEVIF